MIKKLINKLLGKGGELPEPDSLILKSLETNPEKWHVERVMLDKGEFIRAMNREKGVVVFTGPMPLTVCRAGEYLFHAGFWDRWFDIVEPLAEKRRQEVQAAMARTARDNLVRLFRT